MTRLSLDNVLRARTHNLNPPAGIHSFLSLCNTNNDQTLREQGQDLFQGHLVLLTFFLCKIRFVAHPSKGYWGEYTDEQYLVSALHRVGIASSEYTTDAREIKS
jgi:hypothetical protein